ncbi:MAG TPA: methylaspartate mutase [Actinophytocola sp.]|nr:methylaspartate mutase [Actinophytocola sp.]
MNGSAVPSFAAAVSVAAARGELVVQPRMGFADAGRMRTGLLATRAANAATVGTITLDSYTRVGDFATLRGAGGAGLNGYPIVTAGRAVTSVLLADVRTGGFPVQVRHGSAGPEPIVEALADLSVDATEGGPVSYCLPYGRVPLSRSVHSWATATRRFAELAGRGLTPHLESFGGCLLGQLCPPALLVAVSVLEGMFFRQHGIRSVSLSLTQQTSEAQDLEALHALRTAAAAYLSDVDWHVVLYAYMGVYPRTPDGAARLRASSARLAVRGGAERLIVKTEAEAYRIPTIAENVAALEHSGAVAAATVPGRTPVPDTGLHAQAVTLIDAVLDLDADLGKALIKAFAAGYLDVPYCLHADNGGRTRSYVDDAGWLRWSSVGAMPIRPDGAPGRDPVGSSDLLTALSYTRDRYDEGGEGDELPVGAGVAAL